MHVLRGLKAFSSLKVAPHGTLYPGAIDVTCHPRQSPGSQTCCGSFSFRDHQLYARIVKHPAKDLPPESLDARIFEPEGCATMAPSLTAHE
jgi:hypothetical protein